MRCLTVHVEHVVTRTDKAVLCAFADGREVWIPLSQIDEDDNFEDGPVDVAEWLVEQESLPLFEGERRDHRHATKRPLAGREPSIGRVRTAAFGVGDLIRVEGDKCVVRFPDGKTRTLGSRYVTTC